MITLLGSVRCDATGGRRRRREPGGELLVECAALEPEPPVACRGAGCVHPRLAAEPEQVLRREDGEARRRSQRKLDQEAVRLPRLDSALHAEPTRAGANALRRG